MKETPPETYIVAIPGTDQTEELSRSAMLERLARGMVTPGHWVWSPADQDWKQVSEIPSLKAALPATAIRGPGASATPSTSLLSRLGLKKRSPFQPVTPKRKVVRRRSADRDDSSPSGLSMLAGLLLIAVFAIVGLNYQFIDLPFDGNLAQTPFVLVQAHARLGSFVRPNTLVIHVLPNVEVKQDKVSDLTHGMPDSKKLGEIVHITPNSELTRDNFADFLFSLAKSTPPPPFGWAPYTEVQLTPGWRGQYALSGADWRQLAQMEATSPDDRKSFILAHLTDASGHPLSTGTPDQIWEQLLGSFRVSGT